MVHLEHEFYKISEVAALLRLNKKTLYGWVRRGHVKVGRTPVGGIRVAQDEVLRLLGVREDVAGGVGVDKQLP